MTRCADAPAAQSFSMSRASSMPQVFRRSVRCNVRQSRRRPTSSVECVHRSDAPARCARRCVLANLPAEARAEDGLSALAIIVAPSVRYLDGLVHRGCCCRRCQIVDTITWALGRSTLRRPHDLASSRISRAPYDGAGRAELPAFLYAGTEDAVAVPVPYATDCSAPARSACSRRGGSKRPDVRSPWPWPPATSGSAASLALESIGARRFRPRQNWSRCTPRPHPIHRWAWPSIWIAARAAAHASALLRREQLADLGARRSPGAATWLGCTSTIHRDRDAPARVFLPWLCQHCTNAPCERSVPCTHLSLRKAEHAVYARCVGTHTAKTTVPTCRA